jgi:hypothetical protein
MIVWQATFHDLFSKIKKYANWICFFINGFLCVFQKEHALLLNNETVFIKNIVLKFMYVASYLLQNSSLGLLYTAACIPSMRGNISGNHFV